MHDMSCCSKQFGSICLCSGGRAEGWPSENKLMRVKQLKTQNCHCRIVVVIVDAVVSFLVVLLVMSLLLYVVLIIVVIPDRLPRLSEVH